MGMRNGEHYIDPTAGKALRKCRVAKEADLERMDSLRPHVPTVETISEQDEQIAVNTWANYSLRKYPALKWLFHIPNGGSRHPAEALNLKRMGVKPGVPDLFLPFPNGEYHGLWIEMKSMTGRPTACQTEWMEYLETVGYKAVVCKGAEAAIQTIIEYLNTKSVPEYEMLESENREQGVYIHDRTRT